MPLFQQLLGSRKSAHEALSFLSMALVARIVCSLSNTVAVGFRVLLVFAGLCEPCYFFPSAGVAMGPFSSADRMIRFLSCVGAHSNGCPFRNATVLHAQIPRAPLADCFVCCHPRVYFDEVCPIFQFSALRWLSAVHGDELTD